MTVLVVALLAAVVGAGLNWSAQPRLAGAFARCHTAREIAPKAYAAPPAMCIDPKRTYSATLHTTKGDLTVTFFPDVAPVTVNNFIVLAVNGYFDGLRFFRQGTFYWQSGDPNEDGTGGPGYLLPDEDTSSQPWVPGSLGMARFADGVSGGQFFITTGDWPGGGPPANFNHFATLTLGNDILGQLTTSDRITSVTVTRA